MDQNIKTEYRTISEGIAHVVSTVQRLYIQYPILKTYSTETSVYIRGVKGVLLQEQVIRLFTPISVRLSFFQSSAGVVIF